MLRELNENEMMMVSGGLDEVVVTARRISTPDAGAGGYQPPVAGSSGWSYELNGQEYQSEDEWIEALIADNASKIEPKVTSVTTTITQPGTCTTVYNYGGTLTWGNSGRNTASGGLDNSVTSCTPTTTTTTVQTY